MGARFTSCVRTESVAASIYRYASHPILIRLDDVFRGVLQPDEAGQQVLVVVNLKLFSNPSEDLALSVQLRLHGSTVAILGVLDDEHHPKGDDCGTGVDDELIVGITKPILYKEDPDKPTTDQDEREQDRGKGPQPACEVPDSPCQGRASIIGLGLDGHAGSLGSCPVPAGDRGCQGTTHGTPSHILQR